MDCDMFLEALHSFKIYDIFQFYYHFYSLTSKVHVHNTMCCQGLLHLIMFHINFYIISMTLVILNYCVYFSGLDIQCKNLLNDSFLSLSSTLFKVLHSPVMIRMSTSFTDSLSWIKK